MAIRLYVQGVQVEEIERQCGFASGYGSIILNSQLAKVEIERLSGELDETMVEGINAARELVGENAPKLAAKMIEIATRGAKEETQLSACAQALKFAEGGVPKETTESTSIQIFVRGKDGELEQRADIFDGAAIPDGDSEAGRKALAIAEEVEDG
jgi:hypothetical protein